MNAFGDADRESIQRTIRFMHSWHALTDELPNIMVPTLLVTGDIADQHWRPADARAAAATMPHARAVAVTGAGHLGPLLLDADLMPRPFASFGNRCDNGRDQGPCREPDPLVCNNHRLSRLTE